MAEPRPRTPPALALSTALGGVGLVLILLGVATGAISLFVSGFVAGALSLGAALYWRSELIAADRRRRSEPPRSR